MKPKALLFLMLIAFAQCKKESSCASYEERLSEAPAVDLGTNDLAKVPYYKLAQVTYAKNDTVMQTFGFSSKTTIYNPVSNDGLYATCPNYFAKYQENHLAFQNIGSNKLIIYHSIQMPNIYDSVKVRISFFMGEYVRQIGDVSIYLGDIIGTIDCNYFDSVPNINSMTIRGKTYKNVYTSYYSYSSHHELNEDSIYYTVNDGIIRASKYKGDVYELVK